MKVKLKTPVTHNDRLYHEGDEVDLPAASAELLISQGQATEVKQPPAKAEKKERE